MAIYALGTSLGSENHYVTATWVGWEKRIIYVDKIKKQRWIYTAKSTRMSIPIELQTGSPGEQ